MRMSITGTHERVYKASMFVYEIELESHVQACSTNHTFGLISYPKMTSVTVYGRLKFRLFSPHILELKPLYIWLNILDPKSYVLECIAS